MISLRQQVLDLLAGVPREPWMPDGWRRRRVWWVLAFVPFPLLLLASLEEPASLSWVTTGSMVSNAMLAVAIISSRHHQRFVSRRSAAVAAELMAEVVKAAASAGPERGYRRPAWCSCDQPPPAGRTS